MKNFLLFVGLIVGSCLSSCGNQGDGPSDQKSGSGGSGPAVTRPGKENDSASGKSAGKCDVDLSSNCYSFNDCVWNVDRCQKQFKVEAPELPSTLGEVKQIAVGQSLCAIDMNDELWCVPKWSTDGTIYPHPTKKYRQVAIDNQGVREKICATKLDGTSVCFDKGKEKAGPTKDKVLKTIPFLYGDTACAFSGSEIYCESDQKSFEKLDDFLSDPAIKDLVKVNPTDVPLLTNLMFKGDLFSRIQVFASFSTGRSLWAMLDDTKPKHWEMIEKSDGSPFVISSDNMSVHGKAVCWIFDGSNRLSCSGGNYHATGDIPADIKTAQVAAVSTTEDHTCVIVKNSGDLKCWGSKKKTKNIPRDRTGVKSVAVGEDMTCIINKDNRVECFGEK